MSKKLIYLVSFVLVLIMANKGWADTFTIENITATASSSESENYKPSNTIDGSGLNADDEHSTEGSAMWASDPVASILRPTWIQYEFDKIYKLYEMWVWNHNTVQELFYGAGFKEVIIEYSIDGTNWTALGDVHEFAQAPGTPNYAHNTTINFNGVGAKYVRLTVLSNWGGWWFQSGLSEVRFFSENLGNAFPPAGIETLQSAVLLDVIFDGDIIPTRVLLSDVTTQIGWGDPQLQPDGSRQVDTEILSLNLEGGGFSFKAGQDALDSLTDIGRDHLFNSSRGQVLPLNPDTDFPAESSFDFHIEFDVPDVGSLYNIEPIVTNAEVDGLPPEAFYPLTSTTGSVVPLFSVDNPNGEPPAFFTGGVLGISADKLIGLPVSDSGFGEAALTKMQPFILQPLTLPALVIDNFDVDAGPFNVSDPDSIRIIGGTGIDDELDIQISLQDSMPGEGLSVEIGDGLLHINVDDGATGKVLLSHDNKDGDAGTLHVTPGTGLDGFDITDGGTQDGIKIEFAQNTAPFNTSIVLFSDKVNSSEITRTIQESDVPFMVPFLFADSIPNPDLGPADLANIEAILIGFGLPGDIEGPANIGVETIRTIPRQLPAPPEQLTIDPERFPKNSPFNREAFQFIYPETEHYYEFIVADDRPWGVVETVDSGKVFEAGAGAVGDNESQSFALSFTSPTGGIGSFTARTSSEQDSDELTVSVNGEVKHRLSGEMDWTSGEFTIPQGRATVEFKFSKDGSGSDGQDNAQIKEIRSVVGELALIAVIAGDKGS